SQGRGVRRDRRLTTRSGTHGAGGGAQPPPAAWRSFGNISVHTTTPIALRRGQPVPLRPTEHRLVLRLLASAGEPVSRQELARDVWRGRIEPTNRTIDRHICMLRRKLELDPKRPRYLLTIRGRSYGLVTELDEDERRRA
ncbi:MAG: winged helix-turn-helix domain-containing protein, partial [Gemmatimonadaceae bacterium]